MSEAKWNRKRPHNHRALVQGVVLADHVNERAGLLDGHGGGRNQQRRLLVGRGDFTDGPLPQQGPQASELDAPAQLIAVETRQLLDTCTATLEVLRALVVERVESDIVFTGRAVLRAADPSRLKLKGLRDGTPTRRRVLEDVRLDIESGVTFFDAMSAHPEVFSAEICNLIRAGEHSGQLMEIGVVGLC